MNFSAAGSPLMARASGSFYGVLFLALGIITCFFVIYIILKKIKSNKSSEAWIEQEKQRLTKQSDVKKLAALYEFSKNEANLLWNICRISQAKNIYYLYKNDTEINEIFRTYYFYIKENGLSEEVLNSFYILRGKIDKARSVTSKLTSTRQIIEGTIAFYITKEMEQLPFALIKNDKNFLQFEIPDFLATSESRPKELERIRFTFKSSSGMTYNFISRIIRYEQKEVKWTLICGHATSLETQTQRQFQREFVNESCNFSAVNVEQNKKEIIYTPSEKKFTAVLKNISAGGCCIHTNLPIKENQFLSLEFPSLDISANTIGQIRHTRKSKDGNYALHIQFIKIEKSVMNKIFGFVYKYEL